jgi:hypothetical protein
VFWGIIAGIVAALLLSTALLGPFAALLIARRGHSDDELDNPSKMMVRRLEHRAAAREAEAYAVLVLMLGLLVGATVVFLEAKTITTHETGGTPKQKLDDAVARQKSDQDRMKDAKSRIEAMLQPIISSIGHANPLGEQDVDIALVDATGKVKSKDQVVSEINNRPANKPPQFSGILHVHIHIDGVSIDEAGNRTQYGLLTFFRLLNEQEIQQLTNREPWNQPD